jgi:hypothetical protein
VNAHLNADAAGAMPGLPALMAFDTAPADVYPDAPPAIDAPIVDHALYYARRGWHVFPCGRKVPLTACDHDASGNKIRGTGGFYKATTDEDQIRRWWRKWPQALIGIRAGQASGIFVIDVDGAAGLANWNEIVATNGAVPPTHMHRTPGGGVHLVFKWRDDRWVTNSPGQLKGLKIDVRGQGGYFLAPPSMAKSGKRYEVADPLDFFEFAEAPDWLYELILKKQPAAQPPTIKQGSTRGRALETIRPPAGGPATGDGLHRYIRAALNGEHKILAAMPADSGRNNQLNDSSLKLGHYVGGGVLDEQSVIAAMLDACSANGSLDEDGRDACLATIRSGLEAGKLEPKGIPERSALADRPTIQVAGGNLPEIVTQAEQALIAGDFSLYQRGSLIVKPAPVPVDIADNKTTTAIRLAAVRTHLLVELMTKAATWQRFDIRKNDWVPIDCPERVANTLLAREQWGLPVLSGIVTCPVLRADGSVIDKPGYDAATGLLFDPQGTSFSAVPDNPDKAAAQLALAILKDLIKTFPFVTDADQSVALSAILTALHRRSLPTAPLHGFSAPGAGSGKSKLVDIASLIVDGREAAVMSLGRSEEEAEKRLGAALLAGDAIVSIDNIDPERAFGGELFCQALTQRMLKIRILGFSKIVEVPSNAAIFANGNNLTLVGDMTRRAIMCNIDSGEERPELRVFDRNPLAMVRADRNKYVIAALTVLKALYVAKPLLGASITPLGSFEDWSDLIRCGLIWLGEADPCDTMEKIRKKDPRLGAAITVVSQWLEVIGWQDSVTAKDMINHAIEEDASPFQYQSRGPRDYKHPEFRDALLIVAGDGGSINSLKLGRWLGANQDRSILGHKIIQNGERGGSKLWMLEPKAGPNAGAQPRF